MKSDLNQSFNKLMSCVSMFKLHFPVLKTSKTFDTQVSYYVNVEGNWKI